MSSISAIPAPKARKQRREKSAARSSKFKGVRWHRVQNKWQAGIQIDGKHVYLGLHPTEEGAANAYKAAAERHEKDLEVTGVKSRRGLGEAKSSKFRGVRWQRHQEKWYAGIQFKGKHHYLGMFDTEEGAARKYDEKCLELRGDNAALNLPAEGQRGIGQPSKSEKRKRGSEKGPQSKYSSVTWDKKQGKWKAADGKQVFGYYDNEDDAAGALPEKKPMPAVNPVPVEVGGKRTHDDILSGGMGMSAMDADAKRLRTAKDCEAVNV